MRLAWIIGVFCLACGPARAHLRAADGLAALEAAMRRAPALSGNPWPSAAMFWRRITLAVFGLARRRRCAFAGYTAAAESGHCPHRPRLAGLLAAGKIGMVAARWYAAAAQQGNAGAAHSLGVLHDRGLLGDESRTQASRWFRQAAEAGHVPAQFALGTLLTEENVPEAAQWFARAAEAGHVEAQFNHARGLEPTDPVAARRWYASAAIAGFGASSYNLALMHARGAGCGAKFFGQHWLGRLLRKSKALSRRRRWPVPCKRSCRRTPKTPQERSPHAVWQMRPRARGDAVFSRIQAFLTNLRFHPRHDPFCPNPFAFGRLR